MKSYSSFNHNIQNENSMSHIMLGLLSEVIGIEKRRFPKITSSDFIKKGVPNDVPSLITNKNNTFKTILFNRSF